MASDIEVEDKARDEIRNEYFTLPSSVASASKDSGDDQGHRKTMLCLFFVFGIVHGVRKAGELLAQHFPRRRGDANQLSDEAESD
jgi:hypothetical protein